MALSRELLRVGFQGLTIQSNPILISSGAKFETRHADAITAIVENPDDFRLLVLAELKRWPLIDQYLGHLARARVHQLYPWLSIFLQSLFDNQNALEERIRRIHTKVENFSDITTTVFVSTDPNQWADTDEIILDVWAELLAADLFLNNAAFGYEHLEKVVRGKSEPSIDFIATRHSKADLVEVTRIRKRDFDGDTFPNYAEDLQKQPNLGKLQNALKTKLKSKEAQIAKFIAAETKVFNAAIVMIKTSQWEYQDGSDLVYEEIRKLLSKQPYPHIDEVVFVYDIQNFERIAN